MAGFTDFSESLVLNWLLTSGSPARPTSWYIALYTVAPSDTGGGTEVAGGGGYVRESCTFSVSGTTPTTASNSASIEYPEATAGWGTVVAAGVMTAASAGTLLAYANLTTSKAIDTGDILRFNTGEIDITLD